ncbi:MAG: DUF4172 domain-containing protein [Pseudomonadota bacterium]
MCTSEVHNRKKALSWESRNFLVPLGTTRFLQGTLLAKIQDLGFEDQQKAYADILTNKAIEYCQQLVFPCHC